MNRKLIWTLRILLVMIVGLMALGAGVRTMNAGLSCPDWPLCFGQVIPDFHPAVWFEFVHRAYAGLVALVFFGAAIATWRARVPAGAKWFAGAGLFFLFMQIAAGALTVLWLVKWFAVTSHLMLATLFFVSVLWMLFLVDPRVKASVSRVPSALKWVALGLSFLTLVQILLGGIVASTYAGSVCVDWPLCNGQWVPTWAGAIGHQIIHRFVAYFLATAFWVLAFVLNSKRDETWMTRQLLALSRMAAAVVLLQVGVGIANLIFYIPPALTVLHQSLAIVLLATSLRIYAVARVLSRRPAVAVAHVEDFASARGGSTTEPSLA